MPFQQSCYQRLVPGNPASKPAVHGATMDLGKLLGFLDDAPQEIMDNDLGIPQDIWE